MDRTIADRRMALYQLALAVVRARSHWWQRVSTEDITREYEALAERIELPLKGQARPMRDVGAVQRHPV